MGGPARRRDQGFPNGVTAVDAVGYHPRRRIHGAGRSGVQQVHTPTDDRGLSTSRREDLIGEQDVTSMPPPRATSRWCSELCALPADERRREPGLGSLRHVEDGAGGWTTSRRRSTRTMNASRRRCPVVNVNGSRWDGQWFASQGVLDGRAAFESRREVGLDACELARLHDRLGVTTVYVTHDQVKAMTGQRVVVMRTESSSSTIRPEFEHRRTSSSQPLSARRR